MHPKQNSGVPQSNISADAIYNAINEKTEHEGFKFEEFVENLRSLPGVDHPYIQRLLSDESFLQQYIDEVQAETDSLLKNPSTGAYDGPTGRKFLEIAFQKLQKQAERRLMEDLMTQQEI